MSDLKIEKGIPLPSRMRYPLRYMKTGDSFFVPCADEDQAKVQRRASGSCAKLRGLGKFSVRQVEGGVRVWKIEDANDAVMRDEPFLDHQLGIWRIVEAARLLHACHMWTMPRAAPKRGETISKGSHTRWTRRLGSASADDVRQSWCDENASRSLQMATRAVARDTEFAQNAEANEGR